MRLSVVVPTRDRRPSLERVLNALCPQLPEVAGGAEVVVVDDGSEDGTQAWLSSASGLDGVRVLGQRGAGPAAARNLGAGVAAGELLLFIGDDTTPEPGLLVAHDKAHQEAHAGTRAVLGYTAWDEERMDVTPLLRFLNDHGPQFGYALIRDPEDVPFNFFYTSNVSLPRAFFLEVGGFDTAFPLAAWEDIDFAYRATRVNVMPMRIVYRQEARVRHHHPTDLAGARARQRIVGRAGVRVARKWPALADWVGVNHARALPARRPVWIAGLERLVSWAEAHRVRLPGGVYHRVLRWDYLDGLRSALREGDGV